MAIAVLHPKTPPSLMELHDMDALIDYRQMTEKAGIYARVKALVKVHELPPNTRLLASQLSEKMGRCGEKVVREALLRLVREGLVIEIPFKGYFTRKFSVSEICKLYEVNKIVLDRSLEELLNNPDPGEIQPFSGMISKKSNTTAPVTLSPGKLVQITYDLFMHIVNQSARPGLIRIALCTNERLNYIRACECTLIDYAEEELGYLCHLYNGRYIEKLRHAVEEYHTARFRIIPRLMEVL